MYREISDAIEYFSDQGIPKDILINTAERSLKSAVEEEKYFCEELRHVEFNQEDCQEAIIEAVVDDIEDTAWNYKDNNTNYWEKWYDLCTKIGELLTDCSDKVIELSWKLDKMEVITNDDRADYGNLKRELDIVQAKKDVLEQILDETDIEN